MIYSTNIRYNFNRFILVFNSWKYWIFTPYEELQSYTKPYSVTSYWSYHKNRKTVAINFWCIINDGVYEMFDEYHTN